MIDYYTYWAERRVDFWQKMVDWFTDKFSLPFAMVTLVSMFISWKLWMILMALYAIAEGTLIVGFRIAVRKYGQAAEMLETPNLDG